MLGRVVQAFLYVNPRCRMPGGIAGGPSHGFDSTTLFDTINNFLLMGGFFCVFWMAYLATR